MQTTAADDAELEAKAKHVSTDVVFEHAETGLTGRSTPPVTPEQQLQRRQVVLQIALLTGCSMAYSMASGACMPLYSQYAASLGLGESAGGLVIAAPSASRVLLNLRLGQLADELGRKKLLVGGCLVMAVGSFLTAAATGLWMMLGARLLMGAGGAASDIAAQACRLDIVARYPARRGMLLGLAQSLTMLAYAAGPVLGGRLATDGGVRVPFEAMGVVLLVCAPLYALLPDTAPATGASETIKSKEDEDMKASSSSSSEKASAVPSPTMELLRDPRQRGLLCLRFSLTAGWAAWMTILPIHLQHRFGLDTAKLGFFFSLMTVLGFASSPLGGLISDRLGRNSVARAGALASALALGCLPAAWSMVGFWMLMAVWEVGEATMNAAATAASADLTRVELRGAQSSLLSQVQDATFVVMPTALGALAARFGTDVALVLTAASQLCAIAGFAVLMRDCGRSAQSVTGAGRSV